jgi:hypothetical protein
MVLGEERRLFQQAGEVSAQRRRAVELRRIDEGVSGREVRGIRRTKVDGHRAHQQRLVQLLTALHTKQKAGKTSSIKELEMDGEQCN